jgi:hypothetical protein
MSMIDNEIDNFFEEHYPLEDLDTELEDNEIDEIIVNCCKDTMHAPSMTELICFIAEKLKNG